MKDNKNRDNFNQNIYDDISIDSAENNNIFKQNNKKDDSLEKYFKPMEENLESEDILKQLEKLNLSEEKSFDMPQKNFEPFSDKNLEYTKKKNNSIITEKRENKSTINKEDLYNLNNDKKNDINDKYLRMNLLNEIQAENNNGINDNNKEILDEVLSNGEDNEKLSEILLKEKLNRICASIQGYTLNQKCYQNLNNFMPFLTDISQKLYQPLDKLFDVFIELLMRIKQEFNVKENLIHKLNDISLNNEGYEKKILKLKKEVKDKEREIGSLINKVTVEKEKIKDNSKSRILEINALKKENQQLNNKLTLYKNQIRKSEADYKAIQNKLKYYIFERENKGNINPINNNDKNKESNNKENNIKEEFKINNEKYLAIKKLNMSLVYLLKDINKNICKYDFTLNKIINDEQRNNYQIDDLNYNIETNLLIDENNCKTLCNNFMLNMDIINNKIIDVLKKKNDISDKSNQKIYQTKIINNNNNVIKQNIKDNSYTRDKSLDNLNNKIGDNSKEEYLNNNKKDYSNKNNKINIPRNNASFNNRIVTNNNQGFGYKKVGRSININNNIKTKYEYPTQNYEQNNNNSSMKNERKKNANFLNFYNNDDKDLEVNIETRAAIDPKWYENCKNKKVGYVFDKTKLMTCNDEDERTNGANRK